jgi:hypothetical protein
MRWARGSVGGGGYVNPAKCPKWSIPSTHGLHSPYETRWRVLRARQCRAAEIDQNLCTALRESARAYWLTGGPVPNRDGPIKRAAQ